jgi:hypothetical protein
VGGRLAGSLLLLLLLLQLTLGTPQRGGLPNDETCGGHLACWWPHHHPSCALLPVLAQPPLLLLLLASKKQQQRVLADGDPQSQGHLPPSCCYCHRS